MTPTITPNPDGTLQVRVFDWYSGTVRLSRAVPSDSVRPLCAAIEASLRDWREGKAAKPVLTRADLTGADLTGADLTDADLTDVVLTRAVLTDADLTDVVLTRAVLTRADLTRADLTRADLTDAVLTRADLTDAERDVRLILFENAAEVPGLLLALREGRVDGSTYSGKCACLVGTIANVRGCNVSEIPQDSSRPAERLFLAIREGGTNPIAKVVEGWIVEWQRRYYPEQLVDGDRVTA